MSTAERSLPSGFGVPAKSRAVTVSPLVTSFGAQAGEGWGFPSGPFSGGLGLLMMSMMTRIGSWLPMLSWALP